MNSLEWRTKKLEAKILADSHAATTKESILDQLLPVANLYAANSSSSAVPTNTRQTSHERFRQLHKEVVGDRLIAGDESDATKIDLVLAYKDDLMGHMHDLELVCKKADQVLDPQRWPDTSKFHTKLEQLSLITASQLKQSTRQDEKVEELIGIYNDIINSFRGNMKRWDQMLEAHEQRAAEKPVPDE